MCNIVSITREDMSSIDLSSNVRYTATLDNGQTIYHSTDGITRTHLTEDEWRDYAKDFYADLVK